MNLEEEVRDGYTISREMKKVWAVELRLLRKLLEVCERHGLRVFADGGTLLGTVRHHGYIPWDDDIDMVLLRDDYDKLVSVAKEEFKAPYFFQCGYTDRFPWGFAKLRMDGTTAILPATIEQDCHQGIFIDVFPYDAVPDDDWGAQEQRRAVEWKLSELQERSSPCFSFGNIRHNIHVLRLLRKSFAKHWVEYDRLFHQHTIQNNKNVSCISFKYDFGRFLRDKQWYDRIEYMPFEDLMIPVPGGYDAILRKQYGEEYMTPVRQSSLHGGFAVLDADTPYQPHLQRLRRDRRAAVWRNRLAALYSPVGHRHT